MLLTTDKPRRQSLRFISVFKDFKFYGLQFPNTADAKNRVPTRETIWADDMDAVLIIIGISGAIMSFNKIRRSIEILAN